MMKKLSLGIFLLLSLVLSFGSQAFADTFDHIVAFGDSLSDSDFWAESPFTDDKVWIEYLANDLAERQGTSVTLDNRAIGGAKTTGRPIDLDSQVFAYLTGFKPASDGSVTPVVPDFDSTTLFSVWIGGNDSIGAFVPDSDTGLTTGVDAWQAVDNMIASMGALYGAGARNFLIPFLPDVGSTPRVQAFLSAYSGDITQFCIDFNDYLGTQLGIFPDINLYTIDVMGIMGGLSEVELASMYWIDGFHPSSYGHQMIADAALNEIAPVPEPTTIVLFGIGIIGLAGVSRRKK